MLNVAGLNEWRFALRNLVLKDFRVRYRNMAMGILWSVVNPLVMLGVMTFIFTCVRAVSSETAFFPVFVLIGLVAFNLFSRSVSTATASILANADLVKKVAFPRALIPLSAVLSQLMDGLVMVCLLFVFVLLFRVPVTAYYLWIPVIYGVEFVFILGVSMFTSAMDVYYRDTRYIVESGLTILFWLTPIFYSVDMIARSVPLWALRIYLLNPLAGCVSAMRSAVLEASHPDAKMLGAAAAVSLAMLVVGVFTFEIMQKRFADYT